MTKHLSVDSLTRVKEFYALSMANTGRRKVMKNYMIIDFETTGLNPLEHVPLTMGCLIFNENLERVDSMHYCIEYNSWSIDPDTMFWAVQNMSKEDFELTWGSGSREEIATVIQNFMDRTFIYRSGGNTLTLIADHLQFDPVFLSRMFQATDIANPFHVYPNHRMIDVGTLRKVVKGWKKYEREGGKSHNALEDCKDLYKEIKKNKKIFEYALQEEK